MKTTFNDSKNKMNNSSMITAENSTLLSKINTRNTILNTKEENIKYLNRIIFEMPRRGRSNNLYKNKHNKKELLYLTDIKLNDTKGKEAYLQTSYELTNNSYNNKSRILNKDSLPNITEYNKNIKNLKNLGYFNCCDMRINPQFLTRLYNDKYKGKLRNETFHERRVNIRTLKEDKIDYLRKTNDIRKIKYEISLKKEAMIEFKENLKNHVNSINHDISNINSYKENLENMFISKYNDNIRILNNTLRGEKKNSDKQNEELLNLKKDVAGLQYLILRKEAIIKKLEKWLILQIHIKEGKKPSDLKNALSKYNNKLIFETPEDLDIVFTNKENKNLRLLKEYNKSNEEAKYYLAELVELRKHIGTMEFDTENIMAEKENNLINLKKKNRELQISLNELNYLKIKYALFNNNIPNKKSRSIYYFSDDEKKKNELGIFYKPIKNHKNSFNIIDSIYYSIIYNEINGLSVNIGYMNEINNVNTSKSKRANIQMKVIEISYNYLISDIKEKTKSDKNSLSVIQEAYHSLDSYHKKIKGEKNRLEIQNKRLGLLKKIEEKNKKVFFLPRGKFEKYNIVRIQNLKDKYRLKNKIIVKKLDVLDFLHDKKEEENLLNENEK